MWWKLGVLLLVTASLIFCIIPIRTHAVMIDPANPPPPVAWTLSAIVEHMYFPPVTIALIGILVALAAYVGLRIVRRP